MNDILQRVALKAVIVNDEDKILLLREASTYEEGTNVGRYQIPGGRLEPGEKWEDGLHREVAEETGLTVEVRKPLYVGEWHPVIKGTQNQIIAVYVICESSHKKVQLSEDHDAYVWVSAADYSRYDVLDPEGKVIEAYYNEC